MSNRPIRPKIPRSARWCSWLGAGALAPLLLLGLAATAQTPPAQLSATQVLARYRETLGAETDLAAVRALRVSGKLSLNGFESPFVISWQHPNRCRFEWQSEDGPVVLTFDGTRLWAIGEQGLEFLSEEEAVIFGEENPPWNSLLLHAAELGHQVELVGPAEVDGTPVFHLRLQLASGRVQHWYLHRDDFTLVKKTTPQKNRRGEYSRHFYYQEFRAAPGGLRLPHYFEREDRQFVRAYQLEKIEVNPEFDPNLFVPPAADSDAGKSGS